MGARSLENLLAELRSRIADHNPERPQPEGYHRVGNRRLGNLEGAEYSFHQFATNP